MRTGFVTGLAKHLEDHVMVFLVKVGKMIKRSEKFKALKRVNTEQTFSSRNIKMARKNLKNRHACKSIKATIFFVIMDRTCGFSELKSFAKVKTLSDICSI